MKSTSIKFKVQLTFGILLLVAGIWALASFVVSGQISRSMHQMELASTLLRNQTDTDMEHDAIRGDVLGILAAQTAPSLNAPELASSLKERVADFRKLYEGTLAYPDSPQVHNSAAAAKADVEMYLAYAEQIADGTMTGQPVSPDTLAQFTEKFEKLEGSLAAVSDSIEKHVSETRAGANADAQHGIYVTVLCLLLIVGTILTVWRSFVAQFLTRRIFDRFFLAFGLAFRNDGIAAIAGSTGDTIRLLSSTAGNLKNVALPGGSIPRSLLFSPDGATLWVYCWGTNKVMGFDFNALLSQTTTSATATWDLGADPQPTAVKEGRKLWYDADNSANHGLSCNHCHPRGGTDMLGWQLSGVPFDHKGVMVTQSLLSIEDTFPYHWRGERRLAELRQQQPLF